MIRLTKPWLRNPAGTEMDLPFQQEEGLIFMKVAVRIDAPTFEEFIKEQELKAIEKAPKDKMVKKESYARK